VSDICSKYKATSIDGSIRVSLQGPEIHNLSLSSTLTMDHFSGNHDFGGSGYHSYPNISLSSLSPYSSNCYRGRTRMTNTQRSSISLTTHAAASRPLLLPKEHKSFPQSPDVPSKPSLFTAMKSEVKSYITTEKDCDAHLRYELSWEDFVAFREEAKKSLPGWEKLRYIITFANSFGILI
jgi:hypothetical protein